MPLDISEKYGYKENAVSGTAVKSQTTDFDFKVLDNTTWISGGELLQRNASFGDFVSVRVVDRDGVYYPAGTVLASFVEKKFVHPSLPVTDVVVPYAGNPLQGLYLRVSYTSVGTETDVDVAFNFFLHKTL